MLSDQQDSLLVRLRAGDRTAVADIERLYGSELRLFCQRMVYDAALAEDLVQEVLMTCCRVGTSAPPTDSLRGWLYRIARNRTIDELRKMHPKARLSALLSSRDAWVHPAVPVDPVTTPAGQAVKDDRVRHVQLAVDAMEDELREVVILYFFQGLPRAEVAEVIGLTLSGTKARLARAAKELRHKLQALNDSSI